MNTRIAAVFGIVSIVAAIFVFAASPIVTTHRASYLYGFDRFF